MRTSAWPRRQLLIRAAAWALAVPLAAAASSTKPGSAPSLPFGGRKRRGGLGDMLLAGGFLVVVLAGAAFRGARARKRRADAAAHPQLPQDSSGPTP